MGNNNNTKLFPKRQQLPIWNKRKYNRLAKKILKRPRRNIRKKFFRKNVILRRRSTKRSKSTIRRRKSKMCIIKNNAIRSKLPNIWRTNKPLRHGKYNSSKQRNAKLQRKHTIHITRPPTNANSSKQNNRHQRKRRSNRQRNNI